MNVESTHTRILTRRLDTGLLSGIPFWQLGGLFSADEHCFLLDSALADGKLGRFSFLGGNPAARLIAHRIAAQAGSGSPVLSARLAVTRWKTADGKVLDEASNQLTEGDPFTALDELQREYNADTASEIGGDRSRPFNGGVIGYLGYEAGRCLEAIPDTTRDDLNLPDLAFLVADEVLTWDHQTDELLLTVVGRGDRAEAALQDAKARAEVWPQRLAEFAAGESGRPAPGAPSPSRKLNFGAHFDRDTYCAAVQQCREHILAGDVFEVCLTHRLECDQPGNAWDLYRELRRLNPAPFAAYLQFPDFQIVSASPERFLRLDEEGVAESRPIKGTRPRGETPELDTRLRAELATSQKDRAENLMIVDLVRSDLGKVAVIGSVEVPELLVIEDYATVFQLVSTVRADLKSDCRALDLIRACFPGGSMTGAPKIEAMKIIDSIEPVVRGVYSGAIGYLDHRGAMDLSIVIRTIVCRNGRCTFGIGGAVVADSDPQEEYQETLDKAKALIEALETAAGQNKENQ